MTCNNFRVKAIHRVIVQEAIQTADTIGGFTNTWTDLSTVFAQIKPLSGHEVFKQQQLQSKVNSKFIIRYQSAIKDLTAKNLRITFDGRIFMVAYIRNLGEDMKNEGKAFQELFVEENGADIS